MARNAKKCEKEESAQKLQVKKVLKLHLSHNTKSFIYKAIEKGNPEMARIYATNAIRKKNEALNFLRMSARFDAVAAQISSAVTSGMVTKTMASVVNGLEVAVQTDNVEKISLMMDQFEAQCGMLNTQTSYMDNAMSMSSTLTTPIDQVDELIQQVGDSYGLDVKMSLRSAEAPVGSPMMNASATEQNDELTQRLNALRGGGL